MVQDGLVPRLLPGPDASSDVPGPSEEILERLAQTEQLVVQLKELIREKDGQLASAEKRLKVRSNSVHQNHLEYFLKSLTAVGTFL